MVDNNSRKSVIETITSPLGLFALALLIIESTIGVVLTGSKIPPEHILYGLWTGAGLFIITIGIVTFLTIFYPEKLLSDKEIIMRGTFQEKSGNSVVIEKIMNEHPEKIEAWKSANNYVVDNTTFTYSTEFEDARNKAIHDLEIKL